MPKTGRPRTRFNLTPEVLEKLQKVLSLTGGNSQEFVNQTVEKECDRILQELENCSS